MLAASRLWFAAARLASGLAAILLVGEQPLQAAEQIMPLFAARISFAARRLFAAGRFRLAADRFNFAAGLLFAAARFAAAGFAAAIAIHAQHAIQELEPEALATQA